MLSFVFFNTSNKYQVVQVPGKGEGSIATQDLKAGEVILTETPLIQISGQEAESHLSTGDHFMKDLFDALPSGKRDQALKLHSKKGLKLGAKGLEDDIFLTNDFQCGNDPGLCLNLSKIDHSYNPNSNHCWRANLQKKVVLLMRDIKKGEKITTSYSNINVAPREERTNFLSRNWGFICECETRFLEGVER